MLYLRRTVVVKILLAFLLLNLPSTAIAQEATEAVKESKEDAKSSADRNENESKDSETSESEKKQKVDASKKRGEKKDKGKTKDEDKEEEEVATTKLRQISLSGNYVDLVQPVQFDPTSVVLGTAPAKQRSFYRLCDFIEKLAEKDEYKFVTLDLSDSNLSMNGAQLEEFSRRMEELRKSGKKTFAWLENASNVHLAIAACCDEVIIADFGGVDFHSLGMQSMFFRDAMDLVGVKASVVRAGDFKGAVEPFMNPKMSDHLRDHYRDMMVSMNDAMVDRLAKARGMKPVDVRELQAKRTFLPKEALAAGLVDKLAPYGSMEKTITKACGEEIEWVTPKKAKKKDLSFFQLMGQVMSGPPGSTSRLRDNTLLVLHLYGPIVDGKKKAPGSIVSGPTVELIEKIIDEDKIKGVVVRINSPGGSATASESVRQALTKLTKSKPCVVSMGNMAASGGYWVSCIDAPVYAEPETLTGSIGVFSMKISTGALMRRVGVRVESIQLDESAGLFAIDRPWNEDDVKTLQGTIDHVYDRFLDLVSEYRGIKRSKVEGIAGGRVWSGEQAKRLKLVDHLGGVDTCLATLARKAKLGDDFYVIHRPTAQTGIDLSELLGAQGEEEIWSMAPKAAIQLLKKRGLSLDTTRLLLNDSLNRTGKPTIWLLNSNEFSIR